MTRKQFVPGVQFTIGKGKTVYQYQQLDGDEKHPLNLITTYQGFLLERSRNLELSRNSILVFTSFGDDVQLTSKKFKYDQLNIVEPSNPKPQQ